METCRKEIEEELDFKGITLSEKDRLFKMRSSVPSPKPGRHGRGTVMVTYRARVPSQSRLKPDPSEISELITMTPEELLCTIQNKDKKREFEANHAYMYLEYLKLRLPGDLRTIIEEQG